MLICWLDASQMYGFLRTRERGFQNNRLVKENGMDLGGFLCLNWSSYVDFSVGKCNMSIRCNFVMKQCKFFEHEFDLYKKHIEWHT